MISNFLFNFKNVCSVVSFFLTKLLTLGILFSTVVRAVVVAKLLILSISPLTSFISFILALREALVAKLVISGILSSIFLILALYTSFFATSFFTTSLGLLKSTGTGTNLSKPYIYLLYILNCLNHLVNFLIYQYLLYLHQILN